MKAALDVIIIGAGPIGLSCALEAKKKGLNYLIIEKGSLVNSLYNYPVNMTFFSTSEKLEIGGVPFVSNNIKPTRNESLEYYRRVTIAANLHLQLFEEVTSVTRKNYGFEVMTSKTNYSTDNVIIASGFYDLPYLLNVPGEQLPKVTHYYKDPHFYAFQEVLVVETYRKGAEVTMVIRNNEIGERVKYWVRPDIVNRIEEGSIKAYYNATITAIRDNEVDINTPQGLVTIPNDWVIAMTGYQPDLSFLEKLGIQLSEDETRKPFYNNDTHETNVRGIYLAGVICGGMDTHSLFIENSREHAVKIIENMLQK